jgi:hypothetical protein
LWGKTGTFSVEVTAGDGVAKNTYTINFIEALNPAKEITSFSFAAPAATGVINEADKKIAVTVPFGTDVTNLTPTIVHTGAKHNACFRNTARLYESCGLYCNGRRRHHRSIYGDGDDCCKYGCEPYCIIG